MLDEIFPSQNTVHQAALEPWYSPAERLWSVSAAPERSYLYNCVSWGSPQQWVLLTLCILIVARISPVTTVPSAQCLPLWNAKLRSGCVRQEWWCLFCTDSGRTGCALLVCSIALLPGKFSADQRFVLKAVALAFTIALNSFLLFSVK